VHLAVRTKRFGRHICVRVWYNLDFAEVLEEVLHFERKDERLTVSLETELGLAMVKEVTEVDMEELTGFVLQHEVAWVAISDS